MGGILKDRLDSGCEICMPSGFCTLNHRASKKRQEVTSRIAKYFAPSFLFIPFLLDTRANNVPKKMPRQRMEEKLGPDIHFKLEIFHW